MHTKHRTKHGDSGGPHIEDMKVTSSVDTAANVLSSYNQVTTCAHTWWLSLSRTPCSWRLILLIGLVLPLSSVPAIFVDRQYLHTFGPVTQWISSMPDDNPLKPVSGIRPPPSLNVDSNICENWKLFKQKWTNYAVITQLAAQTQQYRVALFLHTIGDEALKVFNGFTFATADANRTVEEIIAQFEQFAVGEINETYERFVFNKRIQSETESFETFLTSIRSLVKTCNYCANCLDSILRDRIVLGINDSSTQTALLKERNLTLQNCIDICKAAENAATQGKSLRPETVNKVAHSTDSKPTNRWEDSPRECKYCGKMHLMKKEECPAWGKKCQNCSQPNHFATKCDQVRARPTKYSTRKPYRKVPGKVHHLTEESPEPSEDEEWIKAVTTGGSNEVKCRLLVGQSKTSVVFQVDTGATVNILPQQYADSIVSTTKKLKMWNETNLQPVGICTTTIVNPSNNKRYNTEFVVVKEKNLLPLIGYKSAEHMNLLQINEHNFKRVSTVSMLINFRKCSPRKSELSPVLSGSM